MGEARGTPRRRGRRATCRGSGTRATARPGRGGTGPGSSLRRARSPVAPNSTMTCAPTGFASVETMSWGSAMAHLRTSRHRACRTGARCGTACSVDVTRTFPRTLPGGDSSAARRGRPRGRVDEVIGIVAALAPVATLDVERPRRTVLTVAQPAAGGAGHGDPAQRHRPIVPAPHPHRCAIT